MQRITLGRVPLGEARQKAATIRREADEGRDPANDGTPAVKATVQHAFDRFIDHKEKVDRVAKPEAIRRTLEIHLLPVLGPRLIRGVGLADVLAVIDGMKRRGRVGAAREVLKWTRALFRYALERGIVEANPLAGYRLGKKDPLRYDPETRRGEEKRLPLSDHELKAVWHAAGQMGLPFGPWVRLLMLTGCRRGEWAGATWDEIDLQVRLFTVPAHRRKTRRGYAVPLAYTALRIVKELPRQEGGYLFNGGHPVGGFSKGKVRLDRLTSLNQPWVWHDLRRTVETRLAMLGFSYEVIDVTLVRTPDPQRRAYQAHEYPEKKREALRRWGIELWRIVK